MRGNPRLLPAVVGLVALLGSASASSASGAGGSVGVYLTTKNLDTTLARQANVAFAPGAPGGANDVVVDPSLRYQTLTAGFGVAMTDSSAYLLDRALPPTLRDRAMRLLFSPSDGIGLSFLRVPMAGSDYVVGAPYSYDDMPTGQTDPTLAHFSAAHDTPYVFPMIREALALNPGMTVMANPWSPPAWMKADDKLVSVGPDGTLLPQYYGAYTSYLVRTLQAYHAAGVPVEYLGVQNEPYTPLLLVSGIPNSYLSGVDEGNLIHNDVAPALERAGLTPKILAYDDGFQRSETFIPPAMATAGPDIAGLAYHCYLSDPSSMTTEHMLFPAEPALETECSSDLSNIEPAQMAIRVLRNWAQGVQLWNAALNQSLGPKIGSGCAGLPGTGPHAGQQCIAPLIVNTAKHTYSLSSDYWALAQFSKFIQLGAQRIDSTTPSSCQTSPAPPSPCGLEDVAFRNPDGSEVLVATTHDGQPHTLSVTENGQSFSYTVPDGGTVTFVWPAPPIGASPLAVGGASKPTLPACAPPSLVFHVHRLHGRPIVTVVAYVDHRRALTVRGASIVRLRLERPPASSYSVTIVSVARGGATRTTIRRYRHCYKAPPRGVHHHARIKRAGTAPRP
jgi:glucosylceramidase